MAGLQSPKPPLIAPLEPMDELPEEPVFDGLHVLDVLDWPDYDGDHWQIDASKVERSMLAGMTFERLKLWDSILVRTDISAAKCFDAGILRTELLGCRMSGTQLGESSLKDVTFENCKLDLVSFRKCRLERVVFRNCVLDEADFIGATLIDVVFLQCELRQTDFNRAHCTRVDMTRSDLSDIKGVTSLKNVRIKPEQMMTLAPLLCAEVGFTLE
ncbi:MAG TPA: pentapeptide repeat-containing protein [Candidatus Saccharimonadales bacterium]|nr:pentapeptide repeat-containing protein [Candidatus Saccharimonadales bacterium]